MTLIGLTGLIKIELPSATVRLCDGGFFQWGAETFKSADPVFGTVASLDAQGEGLGDEVPALELVLLPNASATPAGLSQPGFQTSRVRFWIAEYNVETDALIGTPDLMFDGQIDRTMLTVGAGRQLSITIVSTAERLFDLNIGNSLSDTFHQSVWPGELGHSNATGLAMPIAWGVESPR